MASLCVRSLNRTSLSSIRCCVKPRAPAAPRRGSVPSSSGPPATQFSGTSSRSSIPQRRFSFLSRCPSELGSCWGSLFPLHSAVAAARLTSCLSSTSRSCRALSQEIGLSVPR